MIEVTKLSGIGAYDNNVYVLASGGEAIVVDGADDAPRILHAVTGLRVKAIVQTHNHADHTGALRELVDALGVPVLAHPDDAMPVPAAALHGGETLAVGKDDVRVLHTPGHTPGSLCYLTNGRLLSGDTLFPGGPGNTFGDPAAFRLIMRSLDRIFEMLPDDTVINPGHGADSTIGAERPHVEEWRERGW